jgi:hypothetical protein
MINGKLYRGVNLMMFMEGRALLPKGSVVEAPLYHGSGFHGLGRMGSCVSNAIRPHQWDSAKNPRGWVSFTPHYEVASGYALWGGVASGVVFEVDTELLETNGVLAERVADHVKRPHKPKDEEVVLHYPPGGSLPFGIVRRLFRVVPVTSSGDRPRDGGHSSQHDLR